MEGHWYPQNKFLIELIQFAQTQMNTIPKRILQESILKRLNGESYPYIVVDMILNEATLRRNNQ